MKDKEYQMMLGCARAYIFKGRNYYPSEITPEDLVTETLILMHEESVPFSHGGFQRHIVSARSKMVKNTLDQNPKLRAQHNKIAKRYREQNRDKIKATYTKHIEGMTDTYIKALLYNIGNGRIAYRDVTKEMIDKKRLLLQNANRAPTGHAKGRSHGKFKGVIVTPNGAFECLDDAAAAYGMHRTGIQRRIQSKYWPEFYREDQSPENKFGDIETPV